MNREMAALIGLVIALTLFSVWLKWGAPGSDFHRLGEMEARIELLEKR